MISIITPTHKRMPLFDLTVKSVLSQTYSDYEWVVLDNSIDGYFEKDFNDFIERNPKYSYRKDRVKIIRHRLEEVNIGYYKNECVRQTSCGLDDYVLLLDHDDFLVDTALEDIARLGKEYPMAQFISGDKIMLNYNIEKDEFYIFPQIENMSEDLNLQDLHSISGEVCLKVDDFCLNFGYIDNYSYRYYDVFDYLQSYHKQYLSVTERPIHNKISPHPRCVKKGVLLNPMFGFYEGHPLSEDHVQCVMLGYFCQGAYLKKNTYVSILFSNHINTSFIPLPSKIVDSYKKMLDNLDEFIKSYHQLFSHLPYHNTYLNVEGGTKIN